MSGEVVRARAPGSLPRLSPSGVKTITRCMTKWWLEKVAKRPTPTTPAQAIGLAIHERAENYVTKGEYGFPDDDPILPLVRPGQKFLDYLREGFLHRGGEVERLYEIPRGEWAVPVYCRTDYVEPGLVVDHKSTGDIYSPYIPTVFDLAKDDQMLWYGYLEWRNAVNPPDAYEVQHTYFSSKVPASRIVRVRTTWERTIKVAEKFGATARVMYDAAQVLQPDQLEFNLDACGDFGGCPHQTYCPHVLAKTTGISGLRSRLKRQRELETTNVNVTARKGTTMGFRDRKAAELAAAKAATTPLPGEGQGNASDTPGTETPTEAQLEEIAEIILANVGAQATNAEVAAWLLGDGAPELVKTGLGRPHVVRILRFWTGESEDDSIVRETAKAAGPAADVVAKVAAAAAPAAAKVAAAPATTDDDGSEVILAFLRTQGGKVRLEDKELARVLREVTGSGRLTAPQRNECLAKLQERGLLDYNSVWVFTSEHFDELAAPGGAPAVRPETKKSGLAVVRTESSPNDDTVGFDGSYFSGQYKFLFLVGALPQTSDFPVQTIDDLLADYYDTANGAAVDESGQKVGDLLLWAFGKGPKTVAALVRGDVREGRVPDVAGAVYVPKGHFMADLLGNMFPGATVFRGV